VRRVQVDVKPVIKQLAARTPSQARRAKATSNPPAAPAPRLGKPEARTPRRGGMPVKHKPRT
jgi:hypothetical protein